MAPLILKWLLAASAVLAAHVHDCPGYKVTNVIKGESFLITDLKLAGKPCNIYGTDIENLQLLVEYQTDTRLHVKIYDTAEQVYQIQESILPSPKSRNTTPATSALRFDLVESPFSFTVSRSDTNEVLFNTSSHPLIFESQYLRLSTSLPANPDLYGLGEHSDDFRFPIRREGYRRTLWNADSPYLPRGKNLYGSHPVYFDHRIGAGRGTHGVFLRNAGGMDVDIRETSTGMAELTYNVIGGVFDFYFLAGPGPGDVSRQYADVVGLPAMMPFWSLGFHQSKYGYRDVAFVEGVARLYWHAKIPVETMWADIDYMEGRKDFTLNEEKWPLEEIRAMVKVLHGRGQRFVMMLDPGIARRGGYGPFDRGVEKGVFLKAKDGSLYRGESWAGEVVWPDWMKPETGAWWSDEIARFFDPETGVDVDGLWNDMNEMSNFCQDIWCDPTGKRTHAKMLLQTQRQTTTMENTTGLQTRQPAKGDKTGLPNRHLFHPPYQISNHLGPLSATTIYTNITNADGTSQYDTHNLLGHTMAATTRRALLARKPKLRPFLLTRSTFAGTGSHAAHWFGDNFSAYDDYRISIKQMLASTALHQLPMAGSDICGFNGHADEKMCARWAVIGSWQPFYRNHADARSKNQEFYLWDSVADAARKAMETRYRLLDYLYTALEAQSKDGTPAVAPLWFVYPDDLVAAGVQYQWFYGPAIMVAPVVEYWNEVDVYLPDDVFYDFWTGHRIIAEGKVVKVVGVGLSDIPVYVRGGCIVPMRVEGANTTTELRKKNFEVVVAPGRDGMAAGRLYLDDGESLDVGGNRSDIGFFWDGERLVVNGTFGFKTDVVLERVKFLGTGEKDVSARGAWPLTGPFVVNIFKFRSQPDG